MTVSITNTVSIHTGVSQGTSVHDALEDAVWNDFGGFTALLPLVSNTNKTITSTSEWTGFNNAVANLVNSSGKRYVEARVDTVAVSGVFPLFGIINVADASTTLDTSFINGYGGWSIGADGGFRDSQNTFTASVLTAFATGDIMMMAIDFTVGHLWFGRNGVWSGNPAAGTGAVATDLFSPPVDSSNSLASGGRVMASVASDSTPAVSTITLKGLASEWAYPAPVGFVQYTII